MTTSDDTSLIAQEVLARLPPSPDQPVATRGDDRLRRGDFADALATQVRAATERGGVIALTGPWGSGKTSLLNIIADEISSHSDVIVVRFNPWYFSGAGELVAHFFDELAAQIGEDSDGKLEDLGRRLRRYGEVLTPLKVAPIAGRYIEMATGALKVLGDGLQDAGPNPSLRSRRKEIEALLSDAALRVVVMIDDIDRLEDGEVRDVLRLVRLVADFPGVAYVLAFDVRRVAGVLGRSDLVEGHQYLEKIVQILYPVPSIGRRELHELLNEEVERALAVLPHPAATSSEEVLSAIVAPLVNNVRDVRRYANVLPFSLSLSGDEVAIRDLLALEALRLFVPGSYDQLPTLLDLSSESPTDESSLPSLVAAAEALLGAAGPHAATVERFIEFMLPELHAARQGEGCGPDDRRRWKEERRIAVDSILRVYLEKALPGNVLPAAQIARFVGLLAEPSAFANALGELTDGEFSNLLLRLPREIPSGVLRSADVSPILQAVNARAAVSQSRVSLRGSVDLTRGLISALSSSADRSVAARASFEEAKDLETRFAFVRRLGGPRESIVDVACLAGLEGSLKNELLALDIDGLLALADPGAMLRWLANLDRTAIPHIMEMLANDDLWLRFVASYRGMSGRVPDVLGTREDVERRAAELAARLEAEEPTARRAATSVARMLEDPPRRPNYAMPGQQS